MQKYSTQNTHIVLPSRTVQALPPSAAMPFGRGDTVLVNTADGQWRQNIFIRWGMWVISLYIDSSGSHPASFWTGIRVMQIRLIFSPISPTSKGQIFLYGEFIKFSHSHWEDINGVTVFKPAPYLDMFLLHRHNRSGGSCIQMGDVVPLTDICEVVGLVPTIWQYNGQSSQHKHLTGVGRKLLSE